MTSLADTTCRDRRTHTLSHDNWSRNVTLDNIIEIVAASLQKVS